MFIEVDFFAVFQKRTVFTLKFEKFIKVQSALRILKVAQKKKKKKRRMKKRRRKMKKKRRRKMKRENAALCMNCVQKSLAGSLWLCAGGQRY